MRDKRAHQVDSVSHCTGKAGFSRILDTIDWLCKSTGIQENNEMTRVEKALARHTSGFGCAQCVASVFAEELGVDEITAQKMALGLGGGIGRQGEVCGALSGAILVLGMKYGVSSMDGEANKIAKNLVYDLDQKVTQQFRERTGAIRCNEILGFDMNDAAARAIATEKGIFATRCNKCIQDSVEILEKMLAE
jgi:C_GCAxxG_C_C family probable redox protein